MIRLSLSLDTCFTIEHLSILSETVIAQVDILWSHVRQQKCSEGKVLGITANITGFISLHKSCFIIIMLGFGVH